MFEDTGLKLDEDFLLAFSPERVDPGNPQFLTHNIPKVVGGVTEDSTVVAAHLYSQIVKDVHAVSSARVAEAAKLLENTFRAVNIGMANEMARLLLRPQYRYMGSYSRRSYEAFRVHAFLSRSGNRRSLHSARSTLSLLEGATTRF